MIVQLKNPRTRPPNKGSTHKGHHKRPVLWCGKVKHLKSNGIAIVKDRQLIGMGCGQTSRVDALKQAIAKAKAFGFSVEGAVFASDAFFPFPDCVEIAGEVELQVLCTWRLNTGPDSVDMANQYNMSLCVTGVRHFKH